MRNKVTFDIIVPIYNIGEYLEKGLENLRKQTYTNFKVLMIDDGSTDNSAKIAKSFVKSDDRFYYFFKENGGLSDARNFGISKTSQEYVLMMDGDDFLDQECLKVLSNELELNRVDVLEFNGYLYENDRIIDIFNKHYTVNRKIISGKDFLVENVNSGCMYSAVCFKAIRRDFLLNLNFKFENLLHEDELWTPQLYLSARSIKYINNKLYYYVQREGSIMHQSDKTKNVIDAKKIYYELEKKYNKKNLTKKERDILLSYLARKMIAIYYLTSKISFTKEDKEFVLRNAKDSKSKVQAVIFSISPKILPTCIKIVKKILGVRSI